MKKNFFTSSIKLMIDACFFPFKKNKTLLSYLFDHTFINELEERSQKGELFPLHHIHRSIGLAKKLKTSSFTVLDIGGGIGASAKLYNEAFPDNKIIVFEPVSQSFNEITKRFSNVPNIEVLNYALGNENTVRQINIASRITSSSLLPLAPDPESTVFNKNNLEQTRSETINIVRLDDFLPEEHKAIGIMKIDVQGFELDVLKGGEKTLKKTDIIVLEANNHPGYSGSAKYYEIDSYLREKNFTLYDILPSIVDRGKLKEWDVIYVNNSSQCASA